MSADRTGSGFVFLVGIARTGSKIYMSGLNNHSGVDLLNEFHYLAPPYIRRDFIATARRTFRKPLSMVTPEEIVDLMFSGTLNGTFWELRPVREEPQQRIVDLDPTRLTARLAACMPRWDLILRVLLEEHALVTGKQRAGAKFPVDIGRVPLLMRWFPDAQYVHLIRDPRAIYASMAERELRTTVRGRAGRAAIQVRRLLYLCLQFRRAAQFHRAYQHRSNYYLARFEDTVENPRRAIPDLCRFLGIAPAEGMFSPPVKDSSFERSEEMGFIAEAVDGWRDRLSAREAGFIEHSLRVEMRLFGYLAGQVRRPPAAYRQDPGKPMR